MKLLLTFFQINPLSENIFRVDVRIQIVEVPRQVVMTRDNVSLVGLPCYTHGWSAG